MDIFNNAENDQPTNDNQIECHTNLAHIVRNMIIIDASVNQNQRKNDQLTDQQNQWQDGNLVELRVFGVTVVP